MRRAIGVITAITNRQRHLLVNGGVGFSTFAAGDALSQGGSLSAAVDVGWPGGGGGAIVGAAVRGEVREM